MMERPIICRDDDVCAFLDGRKTRLRRPMRSKRVYATGGTLDQTWLPIGRGQCITLGDSGKWPRSVLQHCPFGVVGDRLWVRECFTTVPWNSGADKHVLTNDHDKQGVRYRATWDKSNFRAWRPSSQMPRWASRITLEITNVRVERLQDITENDARAEGVPPFFQRYSSISQDQRLNTGELCVDASHRAAFAVMWDERAGNKDYLLWIRNPFVWVIGVEVRNDGG